MFSAGKLWQKPTGWSLATGGNSPLLNNRYHGRVLASLGASQRPFREMNNNSRYSQNKKAHLPIDSKSMFLQRPSTITR